MDRQIELLGRLGHRQAGYATESVFELHLDQLRAAAKTMTWLEANEADIRAGLATVKVLGK
ncbi:MAG: hypothetical protein WDN46_10240 [Methylocella sp.]